MKINTVIFDMDGLLVDSEPLWEQAAKEVFAEYGFTLTKSLYNSSTGLRTKEFVEYWFEQFKIHLAEIPTAEQKIINAVIKKVDVNTPIMLGVSYILDFFKSRSYKIGLCSSSPIELIQKVITQFGIGHYFDAIASGSELPYGKPHPQVYLNCAEMLQSKPSECVCFEDSFNGLLAAKSARMKCIVVPSHEQLNNECWGAADLKLSSLQNFGELMLDLINK